MSLSVIVAAARNGVIGNQGDLPWKLSADLKRFKSITMGHSIIMGRKTYESINRLLPGRTSIIVTRHPDYRVEGALIAHSLEEAIELAGGDQECFVIGGAEIYGLALPLANRIYLTRVNAEVDGDTNLPEIEWGNFELLSEEEVPADEKNNLATTFQIFQRRI